MSYIERELLLSEIQESLDFATSIFSPEESKYIKAGLGRIKNLVEVHSAADVVEVVHAYWKETTHITESKRGRKIHSKLYNCSNCDAPNGRKKSSYCHWCGAKMDGERREE